MSLTIYINSKIKYRSVANEVQEATVTVIVKRQYLKEHLREKMLLKVSEAETEHYCTQKSSVYFLQMPNSSYVLP